MTSEHAPRSPDLEAELLGGLEHLEQAGLRRRRTTHDGAQGARLRIGSRELVSFASNDYLGLAADPRIVEAARAAAARHGVGAGASHLLHGHHRLHHELEEMLAAFVGYPRALLFSTGYMANIGIVTALCGRDDDVFADKLNHASLNDAMQLSRARFRRYAHCDLDALERSLAASRARRKWVITDAVFSMDGDIAPVPQLISLCERYGAWLLLDDAHGFGVLGTRGAGTLSHFSVGVDRIVYMGTLGKAAGVFGAFAAASAPIIDHLVNRARSYIYTTAMPPLLAAALAESLRIVRAEDWRRQHLAQLVAMLKSGLTAQCGRLLPSQTPIQPLVLGSADDAVRRSQALAARGLLVPAIRPPTVAQGTARLRISLSAAHRVEDVQRLIDALRDAAR